MSFKSKSPKGTPIPVESVRALRGGDDDETDDEDRCFRVVTLRKEYVLKTIVGIKDGGRGNSAAAAAADREAWIGAIQVRGWEG